MACYPSRISTRALLKRSPGPDEEGKEQQVQRGQFSRFYNRDSIWHRISATLTAFSGWKSTSSTEYWGKAEGKHVWTWRDPRRRSAQSGALLSTWRAARRHSRRERRWPRWREGSRSRSSRWLFGCGRPVRRSASVLWRWGCWWDRRRPGRRRWRGSTAGEWGRAQGARRGSRCPRRTCPRARPCRFSATWARWGRGRTGRPGPSCGSSRWWTERRRETISGWWRGTRTVPKWPTWKNPTKKHISLFVNFPKWILKKKHVGIEKNTLLHSCMFFW